MHSENRLRSHPTAVAYVLQDGEGEVLRLFGNATTVKSAGPSMDVAVVVAVAGSAWPLHARVDADQAVFVLRGAIRVATDDEILRAGQGAFVYLPRDCPGVLSVESASARLLVVWAPSGHLDAYSEIAAQAAL